MSPPIMDKMELLVERVARAIHEARRNTEMFMDETWEELLALDAQTPDEENDAYFELERARRDARAAIAAIPADEGLREAWVPRLGERVRVTEACKYGEDWTGTDLWVAGLAALPGGGVDVTVSEKWPLPTRCAFGGSQGHLTDGFIVGRTGDEDELAALSPTLVSEGKDSGD